MYWLIVSLLLISIACNVILIFAVLGNRSVIRGKQIVVEPPVTARIVKNDLFRNLGKQSGVPRPLSFFANGNNLVH